MPVPGCFCRTSGRITLNYEYLALISFPAFTICQLTIAVKRKLGLGKHIGLCLLFSLTYLCGFICALDNIFKLFRVFVKEMGHTDSRNICNHLGGIRVIQLCLCLPFKPGIRMLYGNDRSHSVSYICTSKISVLVFKYPQLPGILVYYRGEFCLKARDMTSTLLGKYGIAKSKDIFLKNIHKLKSDLHFYIIRRIRKTYYITDRLLTFIQSLYISA